MKGEVVVTEADGTVLDEPFLDVRDRMVELMPGFDERGLLGLASIPTLPRTGESSSFTAHLLGPKRLLGGTPQVISRSL